MKKKIIGECLGFFIGLIIGIYWLMSTGSYFLLIVPIFVCYVLGLIFGNNLDNPEGYD